MAAVFRVSYLVFWCVAVCVLRRVVFCSLYLVLCVLCSVYCVVCFELSVTCSAFRALCVVRCVVFIKYASLSETLVVPPGSTRTQIGGSVGATIAALIVSNDPQLALARHPGGTRICLKPKLST